MTSRSYPDGNGKTRIDCPCCRRELVLDVKWYDSADMPTVTLDAVPLTEQPCARIYSATACDPRDRGARCNWLQPWRKTAECYNDPSHVTPCYGMKWLAVRARGHSDRRYQALAVARCVQ